MKEKKRPDLVEEQDIISRNAGSLSGFASYRPTTTNLWFDGFSALTTLTSITNLNTSSTTDMGYMFRGCTSLKTLPLSSLNTANVTNMYSMFDGCTSLTTLDLSTFDMSKVTSSNYMVRNCSALKSITIPATMTKAQGRLVHRPLHHHRPLWLQVRR